MNSNNPDGFFMSESLAEILDPNTLQEEKNNFLSTQNLKFHSLTREKSKISFFAPIKFCQELIKKSWNETEQLFEIEMLGYFFILSCSELELLAVPNDAHTFLVSLRIETVKIR